MIFCRSTRYVASSGLICECIWLILLMSTGSFVLHNNARNIVMDFKWFKNIFVTFCTQFGVPTHINYEEPCLCTHEAIRHVNRKVMKSTGMCACLRWPSLDCFEKLICVELGNYKLILTTESFRLCRETNISMNVHPNVSPFTKKAA